MKINAILLFIIASTNMLLSQSDQGNVKHVKVYYEPGMFGGWPANHGIWIWDNEILVGFSKGYYKDLGESHNIDREKEESHLLARSLDGGETWNIEDPGKLGALILPDSGFYHGIARKDVHPTVLKELKEPINFEHPDFCLTARSTNTNSGISRYWYSYDRGHIWEGPFKLPNFDTPGTAARTDYIIDNEKESTMFITVSKENGKEGRPICIRTTNGGESWSRVSLIGSEPEGYSIMPASVRISKNEILVLVRNRVENKSWIEGYLSKDNGQNWIHLINPVEDTGVGNPPALVKMRDGRICLIYGYRADEGSILAKTKTSDIRAKISNDNGRTWSRDYILRNDGSGQDIGYPRVVQRPDGKIVAIYYFMDKETGRERYIGATIWDPPTIAKEIINKEKDNE